MLTLPSALTLFSKNAIKPLGEAKTVLFKVVTNLLPSFVLVRIDSLLAWASPKIEQEPTSKYLPCLGLKASTSHDLTFKSAKSPLQHSNVLTGMSKLLKNSTVYDPILLYQSMPSSALHKTTISSFSNWCTRYNPLSSLPCAPTSFLKQGEYDVKVIGSLSSSTI